MRVLVDADSMKPRVREIIGRASGRRGLELVFVANRELPLPAEGTPRMEVASDAAEWIVGHVSPEDLVITRDVPLAVRVVECGAEVITDRGEHLTRENVGRRASERRFAMELRRRGELRGSGKADGARELAAFANLLDRRLTARMRGPGTARSAIERRPEVEQMDENADDEVEIDD